MTAASFTAWASAGGSAKTVEGLQAMLGRGSGGARDEPVAAIVRRAKDDAVAGLCEFGYGLLEGCGGDGRGVGVDEADTAVAAGEKVFGGGGGTFAVAFAALRDQGEVGGEKGVEEAFVADRGVGDDAGGVAGCGDGRDVICSVAEEG